MPTKERETQISSHQPAMNNKIILINNSNTSNTNNSNNTNNKDKMIF